MSFLKKLKEKQAAKQDSGNNTTTMTSTTTTTAGGGGGDDDFLDIKIAHSAEALAVFSSSVQDQFKGQKITYDIKESDEDYLTQLKKKKELKAAGREYELGEDVYENAELARLQESEAIAGVKRSRVGGTSSDAYSAALELAVSKEAKSELIVKATGGANIGNNGGEEDTNTTEAVQLDVTTLGGKVRGQYEKKADAAAGDETSGAPGAANAAGSGAKKLSARQKALSKLGAGNSRTAVSSQAQIAAKKKKEALLAQIQKEKSKFDPEPVASSSVAASGGVGSGGPVFTDSSNQEENNAAPVGDTREMVEVQDLAKVITSSAPVPPPTATSATTLSAREEVERDLAREVPQKIGDGHTAWTEILSSTTVQEQDEVVKEQQMVNGEAVVAPPVSTKKVEEGKEEEEKPKKKMSAAAFLVAMNKKKQSQ